MRREFVGKLSNTPVKNLALIERNRMTQAAGFGEIAPGAFIWRSTHPKPHFAAKLKLEAF
jgi:hypothetical protein